MNIRAAIVACVIPIAWACSAGAGQTARTAPRSDPNLITAEEIAAANASNLFDAVNQLRPDWMGRGAPTALRGPSVQGGIVVYVDRVREGGTEALRSIPLGLVESVRFLSASQAQGEFGLDNLQGAIQVVTRRAR
jgi:hypothetical protein